MGHSGANDYSKTGLMRLSGLLIYGLMSPNINDDVSQIGIKREKLQTRLPPTNEVLHMHTH